MRSFSSLGVSYKLELQPEPFHVFEARFFVWTALGVTENRKKRVKEMYRKMENQFLCSSDF